MKNVVSREPRHSPAGLSKPDTSGDVWSVHRDAGKMQGQGHTKRPVPTLSPWQVSKASHDARHHTLGMHMPVTERVLNAIGRVVYALWKRGAKGETVELSIGGLINMPQEWGASILTIDGETTYE